mmetsp:Transcript_23359/g.36441  ORF Transcript_23359/g.36441 Transcript_23359/m.36441 type:complete len:434 (-) Transcript_23359:77-1378(-)
MMNPLAVLVLSSFCFVCVFGGIDRTHPRYVPGAEDQVRLDEIFTVTPTEYRQLTNDVLKANRVTLDDILSRECKVDIDFAGNGTITIHMKPPVQDGDNFPGTVCLVNQGDPNKPAIVTLADKLSYLHTREAWYGFINKAYYAYKNDRSYYIWIGKLPKETRPTYQSDRDVVPIRWFRCGEKRGPLDGVHALKLLAILTIFEMPNPPTTVLYLDADMFVPFGSEYKPFLTIEKNFQDPAVFMVGNLGGNDRRARLKLMNAGYVGAKNCDDAKRFLTLWWMSQCGLHDQLPLYLSMMAYYSSVSNNFTFSVDELKLYHYGRALKGALPYYYVKDRIGEIKKGPRCHNSKRVPVDPEFGFALHGRLLVDDPLCGIVTTHVKQNSFCHCHLGAHKCKTFGNMPCGNIWPPPYPEAPLGSGSLIEHPLTWHLDGVTNV